MLTSEGEEFSAKCVILATGAVPRKLGIPGEAEFTGRGVSWCATCDGALFKDKVVAVVGGGDAAVEEAMFLTKFASRVHLIHRRDELRATKCIQERCFANDKIELQWSRTIHRDRRRRRQGRRRAARVDEWRARQAAARRRRVHLRRRASRRTNSPTGLCELDESGYIKIDHDGRTSVPGLFAAGDVTDSELKQVITAAAKGASAAFEALRYIDSGMTCAI